MKLKINLSYRSCRRRCTVAILAVLPKVARFVLANM